MTVQTVDTAMADNRGTVLNCCHMKWASIRGRGLAKVYGRRGENATVLYNFVPKRAVRRLFMRMRPTRRLQWRASCTNFFAVGIDSWNQNNMLCGTETDQWRI